MRQTVGPTAIVIALIVVLGFCYFMYRRTQPDLRAAYDPRNGPPAYATRGAQGSHGLNGPNGPNGTGGYQRPGQQTGSAR